MPRGPCRETTLRYRSRRAGQAQIPFRRASQPPNKIIVRNCDEATSTKQDRFRDAVIAQVARRRWLRAVRWPEHCQSRMAEGKA